MDDKVLEKIYLENLDERIIRYIAEPNYISFEEATRLYYSSKLSNKIYNGDNGIQYLDHKVLAALLQETEPQLFADLHKKHK